MKKSLTSRRRFIRAALDVGGPISQATFAEAEKLAHFRLTSGERNIAAGNWRPKFSPPRRVPHGVTVIGRLFDEGTLARAGMVLERAVNVMGERPAGF